MVKLRLQYIVPLFVVVLLVPAVSRAQTTEITESQVLAMLSSADRAIKRGSVAGAMAAFAKDIKIKVTITNPAGDQQRVLTPTKEQYAMYTRTGLRLRVSHTIQRKNTQVKIYEGGTTALVTSQVYETVNVKQLGPVRAVTNETTIVYLRNGKLQITSLDINTRFY